MVCGGAADRAPAGASSSGPGHQVGHGAVEAHRVGELAALGDETVAEEELKPLLEALQKKLDEHVKQVRLTNRLTTSPVCLVGAEHDYSPQLEKLLQKGKGGGPKQRRIMELNPGHEMVAKLKAKFDENPSDPILDDYAELLFGQGLLVEGSEIPDPVRFNRALADLMTRSA